MKKCPVVSSLYLYNKSSKLINLPEKQYVSSEHDYKESAIDKSARKSFIMAYFLSRKNKG